MKASSLFARLSFCLLLAAAGCAARKTAPASASVSEASSSAPASVCSSCGSNGSSREQVSSSSADSHPDFLQAASFEAEESMEEMDSLDGDETETVDGLSWKNGILIINKKHGVPADYAPGVDPTAKRQADALIERMIQDGLSISRSTSNYRSFEYQKELYDRYVHQYGQQQADTFSARPGFSEHQSGLAFDLLDGSGQLLTAPEETQWLLDHSWEYGFIVRYPVGKESVTGYQAEPWHIRYIGDRAEEIARSRQTLEEYLGVEGGDYAPQ